MGNMTGGWPVFSITVSSSNHAVSVLIMAKLARGGHRWGINLNSISVLARIWTPNLTIGSPAR